MRILGWRDLPINSKSIGKTALSVMPSFKQIFVENVVAKGAETGLLIRGLPEMPIHHIELTNIDVESNQGYRVIEAKDITLKHAKFTETGTKKSELFHVKNWKLN